MRRADPLLALALTFAAGSAAGAQGPPRARSAEYLLAAGVDDVRALWVNPAGLAVRPEASIMAELVVEHPPSLDPRVAQWTLAFNSRGVSVGYERNRLRDDPLTAAVDPQSADLLRVGLALPFRGGAVGGSFGLHNGPAGTDRSGQIGVRLRVRPSVDLAVVMRDIGRPRVAGQTTPISGVLGLGWAALPGHLLLAGEAAGAERLGPATGLEMSYRGGARLSTGGRLPIGGVLAVQFGSNLKVDVWSAGISIGGADRVLAVGTVLPTSGGARFDRVNLTGVSSRGPMRRGLP